MKKGPKATAAIGDILKGLGQLVEKLGEIEQSGEVLERAGSLRGRDGKLRGIYGVQVKVGLGGKEVELQPFGNLKSESESREPSASTEASVDEIREPVCDLFEESQELRIVAEMPGIGVEDVELELDGDLLTIRAERKDRKYWKELQLPQPIDIAKVVKIANNGVLELHCPL